MPGACKNWSTATCLVDIITSKNVLIPDFIGTFAFFRCLFRTFVYFSSVCLVVTEYGQFSAFKDGLKESEVAFAANLKRALFHVLFFPLFSNVTLDKQANV